MLIKIKSQVNRNIRLCFMPSLDRCALRGVRVPRVRPGRARGAAQGGVRHAAGRVYRRRGRGRDATTSRRSPRPRTSVPELSARSTQAEELTPSWMRRLDTDVVPNVTECRNGIWARGPASTATRRASRGIQRDEYSSNSAPLASRGHRTQDTTRRCESFEDLAFQDDDHHDQV